MSGITYFAYGSNMSCARLRGRARSARPLGRATLRGHRLRFHKIGADGSGKCDAWHTGSPDDAVLGVLYRIDSTEKWRLDEAEGLGHGYEQKIVTVMDHDGQRIAAMTYLAIRTDDSLLPFSWYRLHVLVGAREAGLPSAYIQQLASIECLEDPDGERDRQERGIHRAGARAKL